MTSHCSPVRERVRVCVCPRPRMIEGAGDSAETHPVPTTSNPFVVAGTTLSVLPSSATSPPSTGHTTLLFSGRILCVFRLAKEAYRGLSHGVRATERRMLQLRGCYSASPCPLDTGLVRLIVYSAFRATPNASRSAAIHFSFPFFGGGRFFRLQDQKRVWIAGFS